MKLYSYWRSSSSWRVRIVLDYKRLSYETVAVNLIAGEGEQQQQTHLERNPMGQVPVLEVSGRQLQQSVAIMEYLEESHPSPPMLPADPWARGQVRALVELINSGIQPLQNLSVGRFVAKSYQADEKAFHSHFVAKGMRALEAMLKRSAGTYSVGDALTLADACLVPQVYSARRFGLSLEDCPTVVRIEAACREIPAFQSSHPDRQPGAVVA